MSDAEWSVANAAVKGVISVVFLYFVFAVCRWVWRTLTNQAATTTASGATAEALRHAFGNHSSTGLLGGRHHQFNFSSNQGE